MSLPKFNIANHVHYITVNTNKKIWLFGEDQYFRIIIENLKFYRNKFGFKLVGYVIMPWHLHLLWQLSEKFDDVSKIMQQLKSRIAREIIDDLKLVDSNILSFLRVESEPLLGFRIYDARSRGSELPDGWFKGSKYRIWQPDFYDFNVYSEKKLVEKINYIHDNPVRAGLCQNPADWQFSSFRNYYLGDDSIIRIDGLDD